MSSTETASAAAAAAAAAIPPPSQNVINLAWAELFISAIFFLLSAYIAWRHGKAGMVCWPIFSSAFIARLVADIYQIVTKDQPMIPNAVTTMTNAAVLACLSLTLIGIVYECNTILPMRPKSWNQKIMLGVTHLFNTGGIGVATYASAPSATNEGGVMNKNLNGIGSLILLFVVFAVCGWMWPTWRKIRRYSGIHPNAAPARKMLWAAVAAMPFWLVRLAYVTTYAYEHLPSLDPVMGSFATKLVLLFGTYLGTSAALLAGGWLGMSKMPAGTVDEYLGEGDERALNRETTNDIEMMAHVKR